MMHIIYRDETGYVDIELNEQGIDFAGEYAYFCDAENVDYRININQIARAYND